MPREWRVTALLRDEILGGPGAREVLELELPTKTLAERVYAALGDHYMVIEGPHLWSRRIVPDHPAGPWVMTEPSYHWVLRQPDPTEA